MNMLIVGNGFDLAHNMKTHYADFLDFIEEIRDRYDNHTYKKYKIDFETVKEYKTVEDILENKDKYIISEKIMPISSMFTQFMSCAAIDTFTRNVYLKNSINPHDDESRKWVKMLDSFHFREEKGYNEEAKKYNAVLTKFLDNNVWLNYYNEIYKDRSEENYREKNGWIDFESEIGKVVNLIENANINSHAVLKVSLDYSTEIEKIEEHCFLWNIVTQLKEGSCIESEEKRNQFVELLTNELEIFVYILELYLYTQEKLETHKLFNQAKMDNLKIDCLLSYNYTNTYQSIYNYKLENIDYIHGRLGEHNLVLACCDERTTDNKDTTCCKTLKKYYQRVEKGDSMEYTKWALNESKKSRLNVAAAIRGDFDKYLEETTPQHIVYIIGHSLDKTDRDILSKIIENKDMKKIVIFYYKNKKQQLSNLTDFYGDTDIINKCSNGRIEFKNMEELIS